MLTPLVDIGVNLADASFDRDRDEVVARAWQAGLVHMVVTGSSVEDSRLSADLAARHPRMSATAGVHPHHAGDWREGDVDALRALLGRDEVVSVGECGLDYFRDLSPRTDQHRCLEAHLSLAAELQLPVFLHERDAGPDMVSILREWRPRLCRAVIHCFTGEAATLRSYLDLDLHVGLTGWICDERRGLHLHSLVSEIPSSRLMVETDAPYLLPRTIRPRPRSRRNEPCHLPHVVTMVAQCLGRPVEEVARTTTQTARAFFDLPGASP